MASPEKTDPCPCTNPELPQFEWLSEDRCDIRCTRKVLKWLHSEEHIISEKVCAECSSRKELWYQHVATAIATKPPDVVQQTIDFVRREPIEFWPLLQLARLLTVLSTLYQEKMVTERNMADLKAATLTCNLCKALVPIQCTKPPDVVARTVELLGEVNCKWEVNLLKVLSTLYQEKMVTERDVADLKAATFTCDMLDQLVRIQCTKPPDVVTRTAELLDGTYHKREANLLKVLNELFNLRHTLTAKECSEVAEQFSKEAWRERLVLVLAVKPKDAVREATKVMKLYDLSTQRLQVLSELYQKKLLTVEDVSMMRKNGYTPDQVFHVQCVKPAEAMSETADVLIAQNYTEEATMLRVLAALQQRKILAQHDVLKLKDNTPNKFLNLILDHSKRSPEDVAITSDVLDTFGCKKEAAMLRLLSMLHQKKMLTHLETVSEVQQMAQWSLCEMEGPEGQQAVKVHGVGDALCQGLFHVQRNKPPEVVTAMADALDEYGFQEEATELREALQLTSPPVQMRRATLSQPAAGFIRKVSHQRARGGSDPPRREETPDIQSDEAALKALCWVPFDIKTVPIEAKGGVFCLQPPSDVLRGKEEDSIFVEVPPGAVSIYDTVAMHYAIIADGPFKLPEGYRFVSIVVYIYLNSQFVTKPLRLRLPHWYGGKDRVRDGLSFAIAPHSLTEGKREYQFQLIDGGTFVDQQQYGILHIDGHSSLFAEVFKEKSTSVYLATQWEQRLASEACTKIVITYYSEVWLKILAKYWQTWEVNQDTSVRFKFAKPRFSWLPWSSMGRVCGELSQKKGRGWIAALVGANTVDQDAVTFRKRYSEEKLEGLVAHKLYPPAIHCAVTYSSPPDFERPSVNILEVKMTGTDQSQVSFPIKVYSTAEAVPSTPVSCAQCMPKLPLCPTTKVLSTSLDPLDQRPMLRDLEEKVVLLAAGKWFTFGLHLDIQPEALDAIKTPNGSNKEHCLEMFKCWLAKEQGCGTLPRTWSSVLHAVANCCGSEVSQELSKLL